MKVELVGQPSLANSQSTAQDGARERAISKLLSNSGQAQEHPVQNPSQVSPEEMSAVQAPEQKGQNTVTEDPVATETPNKDKELLSTQYAQLARREKALYAKAQARDKALAEREAAIKAQEDAFKAKDSEYQSNYIPKTRLTEDTISVLLENGISYDQITQLALNQSQQDPATKIAIQKLEAQVKAQAEAREADRKAYQEQQTQSYQQAVKQIRADAKALVMSDPAFEAIRKTNSIKDVVELIEETFKQDGVILSVDEACREVEEHLVEKLSNYSSQISKIQQRMNAAKESAPKQPGQTTQQHQPKPTLTNAVGTGKKLSVRERAILAFKNELNK